MTLERKRTLYLTTVVISGLLLIWAGKLVWIFTVDRFLSWGSWPDFAIVENRLNEPIRITPILLDPRSETYFLPGTDGPFGRDNVFDPHDSMKIPVAPGEQHALDCDGRCVRASTILVRQGDTVRALELTVQSLKEQKSKEVFYGSKFFLLVDENAAFTEATPAMLAAETKAYWRWALLMVVIFLGFFAPLVFPVALARYIRTRRQIKMIRLTEGEPGRAASMEDGG